jgi:hypothetical protein
MGQAMPPESAAARDRNNRQSFSNTFKRMDVGVP